jgi:hypothetical protein
MKLSIFFVAAALAYGSSLVVAQPIESDYFARDLADVEEFGAREVYDIDIDAREFLDDDLAARDYFDEDFVAREYLGDELEVREFDDDLFEREAPSPSPPKKVESGPLKPKTPKAPKSLSQTDDDGGKRKPKSLAKSSDDNDRPRKSLRTATGKKGKKGKGKKVKKGKKGKKGLRRVRKLKGKRGLNRKPRTRARKVKGPGKGRKTMSTLKRKASSDDVPKANLKLQASEPPVKKVTDATLPAVKAPVSKA